MSDPYEGMSGPYDEEISLGEMRVDEEFWGEGTTAHVMRFLAEGYDRETMPRLNAITITGREGVWLMGWAHEGTEYPPLLYYLFGEEHGDRMLAEVERKYPGSAALGQTVYPNARAMFPDTPRGELLPIGRTYAFGDADLPEGWSAEWIVPTDSEVQEGGFISPPVWVDREKGYASFGPDEGLTQGKFLYLRNPDGVLVATWDEGRWWTPPESEAFLTMLRVPGTVEVARDAYGYGRGREEDDE